MPPFLPTMSQDGRIRLNCKQLIFVDLHHLHSCLEPENPTSLSDYDRFSTIQGHTEWVTKTEPCISFGWDWELNTGNQKINYTITGHPYSNLQIIDRSNQDLSPPASQELLKKFIQNLKWEATVATYIQSS